MTSNLFALCFDANDPPALARFWAGLLRRELAEDTRDGSVVLPSDDTEFRIRFVPTADHKDGLNQIHLHLTSAYAEEQQETVARSLELGARHLDVGQLPEEDHIVLTDPEGNEYCVIEAGNNFLAGTGFLGELASDGSRQVGHFWSQALDWPLVWDQDEETAIQSPRGGAKISWGGPPVRQKARKNRLHLDLAPPADGDQQAEVDRLVSLGAKRADTGQSDASWITMTDPDGNEFCVLTPR